MSAASRSAHEDETALEARAMALLAQDREDARQWRRAVVSTVLFGFSAWAAGLTLMSWAVHTTDPTWAGIAFSSGLLIGNVGIVGAMIWLYRRLGQLGH